MPKYSDISKQRLATCHPDLQKIFNEVIKHYDCVIICGHRGEKEQNEAYAKGFSKLKWPNGNHNKNPSRAVDALPYPIDWNNKDSHLHFAGFVMGVASAMGIKIRWGGDFNQDKNFKNDSFIDRPHFELVV